MTLVVVNFVVPLLITPDAGNLGAKVAFVFAGCNIVGWVFSYSYLPETKGLSMVEIDKLYASNIPIRHWSKDRRTRIGETTKA